MADRGARVQRARPQKILHRHHAAHARADARPDAGAGADDALRFGPDQDHRRDRPQRTGGAASRKQRRGALRNVGPARRYGTARDDRQVRCALYRRRRTGEPLRREALRQFRFVDDARRESAGPDRESARTREAARLPDRRSRSDSGRRQDRRQDAGRPQRRGFAFVRFVGHRRNGGAGARHGALHVPDDLRRHGDAERHRGEVVARVGGRGLVGATLRTDDGQDLRRGLRGGGAGAHLGRAGLRCGCGGHAPCAARRRDGGCRGLAAGRRGAISTPKRSAPSPWLPT